jgi:hypothetical protein
MLKNESKKSVSIPKPLKSKALSISSQRGLISDSDTLGVVQVDE